jgi:4a-hydroxytetrahydrobiopterin dehydratase
LVNGKLHKTFVFVDFPTLFEFMFKVANTSQVLNHHPNMTSTFNTLTVDYDTWRLGHAISDMDVRAAGIIEKLYGNSSYTK